MTEMDLEEGKEASVHSGFKQRGFFSKNHSIYLMRIILLH